MGGKSNPSMTNKVLLISFVMTLSHIPMLFANSLQGYKEQGGLIEWINPTRTVRIINEMGGRESIKVHCSSIDDDLGIHVLWPGQYFEWSFRIAMVDIIFFPTRFDCKFEWRQFKSEVRVVFNSVDIINRWACKFCPVKANRDGIYGLNLVKHWVKHIKA